MKKGSLLDVDDTPWRALHTSNLLMVLCLRISRHTNGVIDTPYLIGEKRYRDN